MFDKNMMAYCGTYCGTCEWKDKVDCKGCKVNKGKMFWGECDKARCCIQKGIEHCGECNDLPCQILKELFADAEHGDYGERLQNLTNWKDGNSVYEKLRSSKGDKA